MEATEKNEDIELYLIPDKSIYKKKKPHIVRKNIFLLISLWMSHIALGSSMAVVGPSLPYLSLNVRKSLGVVSTIYTARSVGFVATSIATGVIFRKITTGWHKMVFLAVGLFLMAASMIAIPIVNNFLSLLAALLVFGFTSGMIDTADNSLVIYLMGPKKSRPIVQSLHFMVAMGAFVLPFIIRPFLIQIKVNNTTESLCPGNNSHSLNNGNNGNNKLNDTKTFEDLVASPLLWPYVIVAGISLLPCIMFLILAAQRPRLPEYTPNQRNQRIIDGSSWNDQDTSSGSRRQDMKMAPKVILVIVFIIYFILHCGTENTFWSHLFAFGVCSDLKMSPEDATLLNMVFFGGFLAGRGSGVFIARILHPRTLVILTSLGCAVTTGVLSLWGQTYSLLTIVVCGVYGFSISMTFGASISWLAGHIDVTGAISSTWFIGAYGGVSLIPAMAGLIFETPTGAIGMMYLAFGASVGVIIFFFILNLIAYFAKRKE